MEVVDLFWSQGGALAHRHQACRVKDFVRVGVSESRDECLVPEQRIELSGVATDPVPPNDQVRVGIVCIRPISLGPRPGMGRSRPAGNRYTLPIWVGSRKRTWVEAPMPDNHDAPVVQVAASLGPPGRRAALRSERPGLSWEAASPRGRPAGTDR